MKMRYFKQLMPFILFLIISISFSFASDIRGGEISLVRPDNEYIDDNVIPPEFLSSEDLIFYTCIEEEAPIRSSVICHDDASFKDVELYRWKGEGNCYIGAYNLDGKKCNDMVIESEYERDGESIKISKKLQVKQFSSLLDHVTGNQFSDGGWRNSTETASGLWVLSNYRNIYSDEIEMANDWLTRNRNNDEKCWPKNDCSVKTTAKIMAMLNLAEMDQSLRTMHDGHVFLEKWQNFYEVGDDWKLTIEPFEPGFTNCLITYEREHLNDKEFTINETETQVYELEVAPEEKLDVVCDQNIYAELETKDNEIPFVYEGDNLTYSIPFACWPENTRWGECDLETTVYALMTNISEERKKAGIEYVESKRKQGQGGEDFLKDESKIKENAIYSYVLGKSESDEEESEYEIETLTSWLRFRQNNEGSWGRGDYKEKSGTTAYSILGLMKNNFSRNSNVIKDAERWVNEIEVGLYENKTEDYDGWGSTQNNAYAFTVLKNNARPLLNFDPKILLLDEREKSIDIYNPTTFPLESISYEFSEDLEDKVKIEREREEISAYSYIRLSLEKKDMDADDIFGYLTVKNEDVPIAKMPIMIVEYPSIEFHPQDSIDVFGSSSRLEFDIDKTPHEFNCELSWEDENISSKNEFKITESELTIDLSFEEAKRLETTYHGSFRCEARGEEIIDEFSFDASRYPTFPFRAEPDDILINETRQTKNITITNRLDESIDVKIEFQRQSEQFELSTTEMVIYANEERDVKIYNNAPPTENVSQTNTIVVSALGNEENINFQAFIEGVPEQELSPVFFWVSLLALVSIIGGAGFFAYRYREDLKSLLKREKKEDKVLMRIKKLEEKEKKTAIQNMIQIMRMLNKEDSEVKKRLKEEGFTDEEIDKVLEGEDTEEEEGTEQTGAKS